MPVHCLLYTSDQATAKQLKEQGERQEKELTAAKKAVTDSVNQTIKKRRSEIDSSYDKEIAKGQERLKKARTQREDVYKRQPMNPSSS